MGAVGSTCDAGNKADSTGNTWAAGDADDAGNYAGQTGAFGATMLAGKNAPSTNAGSIALGKDAGSIGAY